MDWEMSVILGLTVALVASYAFGSIWNRRIQKRFWEALRGALRRYTRRVSYKGLGSSGFRVAFRPPSGPLRKVEISLILLAREMPPYLLAAYALGRRDRMIFKANVLSRPDFHFEALGPKTPLRKEIKLKLEALKSVEAGGLSRYMRLLSDKPERAAQLLRRGLYDSLMDLRGCLERFSISRAEPHLLLVCRRDEGMIKEALGLLEKSARVLEELAGGRAPSRRRARRR